MTRGESVRAVVYTRVSTEEQVGGTSLSTQLERCRAYARAKGWEIVAKFADEGVSGAKAARPQLDRLLAACRRGEFDAVIVAKLDRFGRSNRHLAAALGELDDHDVAFVSVAESIDSSTPSGRFLRTLLGGAAEFERDMILERTAAGLRARAAEGHWPGGPPPYGFRLGKTGAGRTRLAIDRSEAEVLRRATALIVDEGHTTWTAAEVLNGLGLTPRKSSRWVHNHLRKVLLSPTLGGKWVYGSGDSAIPMEIPQILASDRHAALVEILRRTAAAPRRSEGRRFYLLSRGRLFGACGSPMHGVWRHERKSRMYRCANARPEADPRCLDHNLNADMVEEIVWKEVTALLSQPERLMRMAEDFLGLQDAQAGVQHDQLDAVEHKLARLQEAKTRQVADALKAGVEPAALKAAVAAIEGEERALEGHLSRLREWEEGTASGTERAQRLQDLAASARDRLGSMSGEERRGVLDLLDGRASVTGWSECETCEGRGRVRGGGGGVSCPQCRALRRVPSLKIEGVVLDGVDLAGEHTSGWVPVPEAVGAIPFRLERKPLVVGAEPGGLRHALE